MSQTRTQELDFWESEGRGFKHPDITDIGEVFKDIRKNTPKLGYRRGTLGYVQDDFDGTKMTIGNLLAVRDHRNGSYESYSVWGLNPSVFESIQSSTLAIQNDRTYFQLTIREDGTGVLSIRYNTIIGSRNIALLDNVDLTDVD